MKTIDYLDAVDVRHDHVRRLADFHGRYDLLLTPTTAAPPPRIGANDPPRPDPPRGDLVLRARGGRILGSVGIVQKVIEDNLGWVPYTQLANLTGAPRSACRCIGPRRGSRSAASSSARSAARACSFGSRPSSRGASVGGPAPAADGAWRRDRRVVSASCPTTASSRRRSSQAPRPRPAAAPPPRAARAATRRRRPRRHAPAHPADGYGGGGGGDDWDGGDDEGGDRRIAILAAIIGILVVVVLFLIFAG